eukprot:683448-Pelagomonas_calceolata.AAC.1
MSLRGRGAACLPWKGFSALCNREQPIKRLLKGRSISRTGHCGSAYDCLFPIIYIEALPAVSKCIPVYFSFCTSTFLLSRAAQGE